MKPRITPESLAISASAGSGKTHHLTNRLLEILMANIPVHEILAITFTNKAANEIKDRTLERLLKLEGGNSTEVNELSKKLNINGDILIKNALKIKLKLIEHFSSLKISTIDSFFTSILKRFPAETGLSMDIKIIDDLEKQLLLEEAVQNFFVSVKDKPGLFKAINTHFALKDEPTLQIADQVIKSYYNFAITNFDGNTLTLSELLEQFERLFLEKQKTLEYLKSEDFINILKDILKNLKKYADKTGAKDHIKFYNKIISYMEAPDFKVLFDISPFKVQGENKKYIQRIIKKCPTEGEAIVRGIKRVRNAIKEYKLADMQYGVITGLILHTALKDEYQKLKQEHQVLDFEDIELITNKFLKQLKDFGYFNYRFDYPIKHILIDEFQDTSDLQWETIEPVVINALNKKGSFYYVGDIKQSIYQFRGGNPELFDKVRKKLGLKEKYLKYNYRSAPEIVNFVNNTFLKVNEIFPFYKYKKQEVYEENEKKFGRGYVKIQPVLSNKKEGKFEKLLEVLDELKNSGVSPDDVTVLCRQNSQIESIEDIFSAHGIDYISPGRLSITQNFAVMDIINLLKLISEPDENIYLASTLRSPMFRFTYEMIYSMAQRGGINLQTLKEEFPSVYNVLDELIYKSRYLTPSGMIKKIIELTGASVVYGENYESILDFLEIAEKYEHTHDETSIKNFLEYIEETGKNIKSRTLKTRGIKILTIHASKGLGFHTVILPFIERNDKTKPKIIIEKDEKKNIDIAIDSNKYKDYIDDEDFIKLIANYSKKSLHEELNTLYVGMTRAISNLIIFPEYAKTNKSPTKISNILLEVLKNFNFSVNEEMTPFITGNIVPSKTEEKHSKGWYSPHIIPEKIKHREEKRLEEKTQILLEDRSGILKGLVFHNVMRKIDKTPVSKGTIHKLIDMAISYEGKDFTASERENVRKDILSSIENTITDNRIEKFFKYGIPEITVLGPEFENLIGRIDRILIENDRVYILDFKTDKIFEDDAVNKLADRYKKQIKGYCTAVREIFTDKEVIGIIYFTDAPFDNRIIRVF